ncbi:MAG: DAK2 domain-containing protein [Acidimicrobiia bacterium]|nr:DAK2 domain-containing protein [Acidimicrobiia bacterium]
MPTLESLDAASLRQAVTRFRDALRTHQEELNRLNVYPVPDGDTGTNMTLTLESVVTALGSAEAMPEVCHAISHGSLMGARGNSGVIMSQILRGIAEVFTELESAGPQDFTLALRTASDAAYEAVMRPVEGTILTVVRESAEAAEAACATAGNGAQLSELLVVVAAAARESVLRTPELLPVLRDAGVVDSGARGFTLLFDALLEVVDGTPIPEPSVSATPTIVEAHLSAGDVSSLRYEVMYLLDAPDDAIPSFKHAWAALGDSIVVVGGSGVWNCHVHTDDIGGAVEAGIEAGRPHAIRITDLIEQVAEEHRESDAAREGTPALEDAREQVMTGVVAVAVGKGNRRLLTGLGVQEIVAGGQSMNPSTAQILEAVERCPSDSVIVLPNNKNIVPVAAQVDALTTKSVAVIPTKSVVEALAALVAYDPHAELDVNSAAMADAADSVAAGEVTQAVRDSVGECGEIKAGDWIAIGPSGISVATDSAAGAVYALLDEMVGEDSEVVTVLVGADVASPEIQGVRKHLELAHPGLEVEVHEGGQPLYPYLIGVE